LKFGGSSVGSPERIRQVIDIITESRRSRRDMIVVFSAFQGVTDQLIKMSNQAAGGDRHYSAALQALAHRHRAALAELVPAARRAQGKRFVEGKLGELAEVLHGVLYTRELTPRTLDYIMSFGELLSTFIIAEATRARRVPCGFVDSRLLIKTDETFGAARVKRELTAKQIRKYFREHRGLQMATGFIASTTDNDTTTLGRGGSDYTAALLGAAIPATEIEIWTDVDGVMTADPRKVASAYSISRMTYEEAMEMSHFGAKVIHPPTMQPAMEKRIPLRIRNTFNPSFAGTVIGKGDPSARSPVKGISSIDEIALLRVQGSGMSGMVGIGRRIFGALASGNITALLVTQGSSEYSVCLAVPPSVATTAKRLIDEEIRYEIRDRLLDPVLIEPGLSVVAIVGENMRNTRGIAAQLFSSLGRNGVNVIAIAQGSSELNISTVVARTDEAKALNVLHDTFFRFDTKPLNLYVVGTGHIGGTLLDQVLRQRESFRLRRNTDLRVRALANSRKMLAPDDGELTLDWREQLSAHGKVSDARSLVQDMKDRSLPNSVFVDCTSSPEVARLYAGIMEAGISVVTPNKKANSGSYGQYVHLKETAVRRNVRFLYETNVGAGLPVISTINDLVSGGDRVLRIEGVLSGTLGYIFSTFTEGRPFSEIVEEARARGYTEPDPRDDLSGMDVARKLLIMVRESGHRLELRDIHIDPLLPRSLRGIRSVGAFMRKLPSVNRRFEERRAGAAKGGKVLRYLASFSQGKARVGLRDVPVSHPAASLAATENMIVLTTAHCREVPVIVRGPGAGADVTAAGVLADIMKISHQLY
jgi:aspartokinase/homoserine dehydrogenase 1